MIRLVARAVSIICGPSAYRWIIGLLAIDILARLHGIDGDLLVPMVGRANDDGVDVLALQNLTVVARSKDVVAPEFLAVLEAAVVAIRHGNELHTRNLQRYLRISLTLTTRPDQRDLNMIVRRNRLGRFSLSLGRQCIFAPSNVSAVAAAPAALRKLLRLTRA